MADRSVVGRDISQSVVVNGDGNTVTLTFGDSGVVLPLRRRQFRPPDRRRRRAPGEPPRELDLLVPEAGKLPLVGRQDLFSELQAWIDDEVDISVHALIGRAGTGKTRLALEFCAKVDSHWDAKGDWLAGFLFPAELRSVVETLATRRFTWERHTLLVIDYAAQCHEALARWLDRLVGKKLETKLRILLLDREAPEGFGWWRELTGSGLNTARERRDLLCVDRPRQLPDLSDLEERRALMAAALQAVRDLRSAPAGGPQIPAMGADPDFDRTLAQPQFGNPLALVMAGVIALDQGARPALELRHLEAARRLGRRELDRFAALAQTRRIRGDVARHIVAFNELADGIPVAELRRCVAQELAASGRSADVDTVLAMLEQELPPRTRPEAAEGGPRLATIQPDLIGEAAIIESFTGESSRELEAPEAVFRAYALTGEDAARVLFRLLQDFAYALEDESATEAEMAAAQRLMSWLVIFAQKVKVTDPEHLLPLVSALPHQTTILREAAAELTGHLATLLREAADRTGDLVAQNIAATLLNNLANRLSDLGRREEALMVAEEAVRLRRTLAAARPDAFTPDLAGSLNNLANRLSDLGRREEALTAAEEALPLYRTLAATHPDAFTPDLALSLNNLANRLSDLGRREEALTAVEEAVRLYRALAAARPDAFGMELARSLWVLGDLYGETGKSDLATETLTDGLGLLMPIFVAVPAAVSAMMAGLVQSYLKQCETAGREPDAELLQPAIAEFERINATEEKT